MYNSDGLDGQQASTTIIVPEDAIEGFTRLRIIKSYEIPAILPCGEYAYGQSEDYLVQVEPNFATSDISSLKNSIYPNPTSGLLNFKFNQPIKQVQVYNTAGQLLMNKKDINNQLNVNQLTVGAYILKIELQDGTISIQKFIKK